MKRLTSLAAIATLAIVPAAVASPGGGGDTVCVGDGHHCYSTIQAAVDAAQGGDTIAVAPGRYRGGVTIDKSIRLVGSGARTTTIKGGGPVVTIGRHLAPEQLTVTIAGVTITGGLTTSSPESQDFGKDGVVAFGGGIEVSFTADHGPGAAVTIKDSVITRNRVAPTATVPSGQVTCPGGSSCPFAWAKGGGIDSAGPLTLKNTVVSDNTAAGVASDAVGGGISVWETGSLTVAHSRVSGNRAIASKPNGRFAEGGGIFVHDGVTMSIRGSSVNDNALKLESDLPYFVEGADPIDMNANGGGVHAGTDGDATIDSSSISRNSIVIRDPNGRPYAFDSALMTGSGTLVLRDSRISGNRVFAEVESSEEVGFSGGALDIYGPSTVSGTVITDNDVLVKSRDGVAAANGAVYSGEGEETSLIADSVIAGNTSRAISANGEATVQGVGLVNDGPLRLRDVLIARNAGQAIGTSGFARGGGIWQGQVFNEGGLPISLALERTIVTRNRLAGSDGIEVAGGGVFTDGFPISLDESRVFGNSPDQCVGC
jgi:hypothetical protein